MEFLAHFGLRKTPFTREVAVKELFPHPQRKEVLRNLLRAANERMSSGLEGPAGSGKTTVIREFCEQLPEARFRVHYLKVPGLSKRDMAREIAKSLALPEAGTFPKLLRTVQEAVESRIGTDGLRTVLVLDDAHELRPQVLGMFKALTNYEMDSRLVLSIVLVGQPPLSKLLRRAELLDVAQRLAWYGELRLLSRDETVDYIAHRCTIAGATRDLFDERAVESLYEMSRGNPRAVDHLARRALEVAHHKQAPVVSEVEVSAARRTLRL